MFRELLEAVRAEASGERAKESVRAVSRFHRVQSSPGFDQAADWLEGALREAGLVPEREEVAGDGHTRHLGLLMPRGWECTHAAAVLEDGGVREPLCDYARQPLSLVLRSASAAGRFALIDVGAGTEPADYAGRDVKGKVVLASGAVHRVHRLAVLDRGAAGILTDTRRLASPVREAKDERDAINYTSFWWGEDEPRGWGFVVAPETGDRLRARLAGGAALLLDVRIDARDFAHRIPLITTRVGPEGPGEILVTAHLCHPMPSANDNGSGVAAALETARVLAALAGRGAWRPKRAVRFLWMPELTGTHAWIALDPRRASNLAAALNLDMVGQDQAACGSTLLIEHPPCFAATFATELLHRIRAEALDWVTSYSGPGHYSMTRIGEVPYSGGSDHVTWSDPAIGVPCPMLIQWPDRFYHSSHDTLEHTDPASLALAVRCAATWAGFLAAAGEAEHRALATLVGRGAQRRLLEAIERPAPHARARERLAGTRAIGSLARLGFPAAELAAATRDFERFADAQGVERFAPPAGGPVFARALGAPLDFHAHNWPGYATLDAEAREELRRLPAAIPGGSTTLEIAWAACDGARGLNAIAALVALETGLAISPGANVTGEASLARFFDFAERLGLAQPVVTVAPSS